MRDGIRRASAAAWMVATAVLTLGTALSCQLIRLVPGAEPGAACTDGTPPADRLDGLVAPQDGSVGDPVFWGQLAFNIAWFVPVGVWVVRRSSARWAPVAVGALVGAAIELLQLVATTTRYPSLLDVALNAAGSAVGGWWVRRPGAGTPAGPSAAAAP